VRPRLVSDDLLLDAALAAFAETGYEGASVRAICRRLEVSHNLLNKRYGSKEGLWFAAVEHGFGRLVDQLADAVAAAGEDPFDQLRAAMVRFAAVTRAEPALVRILSQESARPGPRYDHLFNRYVAPINEAGLRRLKVLQTDGRVRAGPVSTIFFHLTTHGLGAMSSHPESFAAFGDASADPEAAAEQAVDMILGSLQPSGDQRT
jgi:AcrR family transcriptional regulator